MECWLNERPVALTDLTGNSEEATSLSKKFQLNDRAGDSEVKEW